MDLVEMAPGSGPPARWQNLERYLPSRFAWREPAAV